MFVVGRKVNVLSKVEGEEKREKLRCEVRWSAGGPQDYGGEC